MNITAQWISNNWDLAWFVSHKALKSYKVPIRQQDQEDAIQDAFMSLIAIDALKNYIYRNADDEMAIGPNTAWFGTLVARKSLAWLRDQGTDPVSAKYTGGRSGSAQQRGLNHAVQRPMVPEPPVFSDMTWGMIMSDIHRCLDHRTKAQDRYHDLLDLRAQGWDTEDMAEKEGVSFNRMNSILAAIRKRLRASEYADMYPSIVLDESFNHLMTVVSIDRILTLEETCKMLGVPNKTMRRWGDKGILPMVRTPGGRRRYPLSGVQAFLETQNKSKKVVT